MISNEKIINYKVSYLFKIYNFYFDGFFKRGHLKTQKKSSSNYFYRRISQGTACTNYISTGGFLRNPPVEIHDFYRRFC